MPALKEGKGGPPVLGRFWLREGLWQRLGLRPDHVESLDDLPWQEADDYLTIMNLDAQIKAAEADSKRPGLVLPPGVNPPGPAG